MDDRKKLLTNVKFSKLILRRMKIMGKKTILIISIIILGIAIFCINNAIAEEDYHWKFIVPVDLKNIHPAATTFNVNVHVLTSGGDEIGTVTGTPIAILNGNYTGNVEVKVKANPGKDPSTGAKYSVILRINNIQPSPDNPNIWAKPKPGTEFAGYVTGIIPQ